MHPLRLLPPLAVLVLVGAARGLEPTNIVLVVNKNVKESAILADFYRDKRGVPKDNVVVLDLPTGEDISRADYDKKMVQPLREALGDRKDKVKALLTLYGVPLRVGVRPPTAQQKEDAARIEAEIKTLRKTLEEIEDKPTDEAKKKRAETQQQIQQREARIRQLKGHETQASVDSELSLLWFDTYDLYRWQLNHHYWQVPDELRKDKPPMLMTARLDGPSLEVCKRLVEDALAVEAKGLEGKVYIDARGIKHDAQKGSPHGYSGYDESMREAARLLEKGSLKVVLDDKEPLFAVDSCPDCALYCGWYSHAKYVACCQFRKGAVAWHLASSEAVSLRNKEAKFWCKNLLDAGVAATLGPVAEPYTIAFPKPGEFFGVLATGEYTLAETYWRTTLFTSWMMVLVGDPLYRPFAKTPKLKSDDIKASPSGWKLLTEPMKKE